MVYMFFEVKVFDKDIISWSNYIGFGFFVYV